MVLLNGIVKHLEFVENFVRKRSFYNHMTRQDKSHF
jgi:hypothetical protein